MEHTPDLFQDALEREYGTPDELQAKAQADEIQERFDTWRKTQGGNYIVAEVFRIAAPYADRYRKTGQRVAVALLWELLRDRVVEFKRAKAAEGKPIERSQGYALCNDYRAVLARLIMDRRPQWAGMFETRARDCD